MTEEEKLELKVRQILSAEVENHRNFLQSQFKYLTWGLGVLLASGTIVFTYLFGKSIDESKEQLVTTIDSKVVEYRIVDSFKKALEQHIQIAVTNAVEDEKTIQKVDDLVGQTANKYVNSVSSDIEERLSNLVASEVAKNQNLDIDDLVQKVSLPKGVVLSFNRTTCPSGWQEFVAARGRYIVGLNDNGTLLATVGRALANREDRPTGSHTHSYKDHYTAQNPTERYEGLRGAEWHGSGNPGFGKITMTTAPSGGGKWHKCTIYTTAQMHQNIRLCLR